MYIQMTEEEVRRDVRLAKDQAAQVEILADINDVPDEVIRRVVNGESWDEATGIDGARKVRALARPKKGKAISDEEIKKAMDYRKLGKSYEEIGRILGREPHAVQRALKRKAAHDVAAWCRPDVRSTPLNHQ